jgi:hypothetical protein
MQVAFTNVFAEFLGHAVDSAFNGKNGTANEKT